MENSQSKTPKLAQVLTQAHKAVASAERLLRSTVLLHEPRLLLQVLHNLTKAFHSLVALILKVEYLRKNISLSKKAAKNLQIFYTVCAPRYHLTPQECALIRSFFLLSQKHTQATMEFVKNNSLILLDGDGAITQLNAPQFKRGVLLAKKLLSSTQEGIRSKS